MSLSLLGGRARGFVLQSPPDNITRPTGVLLKRKLFDWRQNWEGLNFVDLCAGSGSMGLEALSRGAQNVWLNEMSKVSYRVLEKNVKNWHDKQGLDEGQQLHLSQLDFRSFLERLRSNPSVENEQTVLFFDPPWEQHSLYEDFWKRVSGFPGELWVESDDQKGVRLVEQKKHLSSLVKEVTHGQHWVLVGRALPR
ncbi:MAG: RsmD family RNA methyltransferase [Bacteriovoracaceae bacterium]|nr:RsmD family RNA methyltransferase [Bacteriovoracaceae bacterium]